MKVSLFAAAAESTLCLEYLDWISSRLGFESRYLVYPLLALLAGVIVKLLIRRHARKWAEKTKSGLHEKLLTFLDSSTTPLVLMVILYGLSHWLPLPPKSSAYMQKGILTVSVFLLAYFMSRVVTAVIAYAGERHAGLKKFLQPFGVLSKIFLILIATAVAFKILDVSMSTEGIKFIRIVGIAAGAYVVLRIVKLAVSQIESFVEERDASAIEVQKRARTLGKIINNAAAVIVISVSIMMILSEFGMNVTPIITGAGIVGLAVGFGAQNLVRDVISGFFLILEDQIRVGDVANVNGTGGTVEAIRLRTTILRDFYGTVHIFPNGEIKQVANMTKEFSYGVVDVAVAHKENVDEVMARLKEIGDELAEDPKFKPSILAPFEVLGVDNIDDSKIVIKTRIKTLPLHQWATARELRRRIKNAFDRYNIEIPFPHMSIYFGKESRPVELMLRNAEKALASEK